MDERDEWITDIENGYVDSAFVALHEPRRQEPLKRLEHGSRLMAMLRDPSLRPSAQPELDLEESQR